MNIPPGTILQLGRGEGSYPFQNIVATNISGTAYVDGFPTTNTGTSLGQYFHLGIDGQNNKKTDILNVSGTQSGGFNFWTSNSTDAPILLASITKGGIGNGSNTNFLQLKENAGQLQLYDGDNYSQNYPNSSSIGRQSTGFQTQTTAVNINMTQTELGAVTHQTTLSTPYNDNNNNALVCSGVQSVVTVTCPDNQPQLNITDNHSASATLYKGSLQLNASGSQANYTSNVLYMNDGTTTTVQLNGSGGNGQLNLTDTNQYHSTLNSQTFSIADPASTTNISLSRFGYQINTPTRTISLTTNNFYSTFPSSGFGTFLNFDDSSLTFYDGTNTSVLSPTDLTFNTVSILPTSSVFNFSISSSPSSFPCVITGKQYTMTPQSSFSITATSSSINLDLPIDFSNHNLSAVLFRDNVFYPLQVDLPTGRIIVLTGSFSGTQTIYFSGFIFST